MNDRSQHPASIAAAALAIGGALVLAMPQHAMSILRLVIVTAAAGAALYALAVNSPPAWWKSPFDRSLRWDRRRDGGDVAWIRAVLSGRRQRIAGAPPVPPGTLRLLQPLIRNTLDRAGLDAHDAASGEHRRARISPLTLAILHAEPLKRTTWLATTRPSERRTAAVVHHVLNDLERIVDDAGEPLHTSVPQPPRVQ